MSAIPKLLLAAFVSNAAAGTALAAEVIVEKDQPEHARPHFFERVQAGELANAIAHRGQAVNVPAGKYTLRVPCDSMKPGSFSDVTVIIDDSNLTRLRLMECGVQMNVQSGQDSPRE